MHFGKATVSEPTEILIDGRVVRINWDDGHHSVYSKESLRDACPCAFCEQERTPPAGCISLVSARDSTIKSTIKVGRYGIRFTWGDGHDTGIYTHQFLRELCECDVCARRARPGPGSHGDFSDAR